MKGQLHNDHFEYGRENGIKTILNIKCDNAIKTIINIEGAKRKYKNDSKVSRVEWEKLINDSKVIFTERITLFYILFKVILCV